MEADDQNRVVQYILCELARLRAETRRLALLVEQQQHQLRERDVVPARAREGNAEEEEEEGEDRWLLVDAQWVVTELRCVCTSSWRAASPSTAPTWPRGWALQPLAAP